MSQKKINYLQRDFEGVKNELLKFSNKYYPEIFDDFNDSSIGSWMIDLVSAVGDDLNYHIDRQYQETNIDSANLRSTVLNMARTNGLKIPGRKASSCEVEISCELPVSPNNISLPDWSYAPILQRTSIVSAGAYNFELTECIDKIPDGYFLNNSCLISLAALNPIPKKPKRHSTLHINDIASIATSNQMY